MIFNRTKLTFAGIVIWASGIYFDHEFVRNIGLVLCILTIVTDDPPKND
jgi:hypothetical protein